MAVRPYARQRAEVAPATEARILSTAEEMIRAGTFHHATVAELAKRAEVARATVFGRFGSKLGVLEALATRCAGGPEIQGVRNAFALDDPREAVVAVVAASCVFWERQGHILVTLKAMAELEPGVIPMIDAQRGDQSSSIAKLVRRLDRAGALREGLRPVAATPLLHMITSAESFLELRRHGGLGLEATRTALIDLAVTLLRQQPA